MKFAWKRSAVAALALAAALLLAACGSPFALVPSPTADPYAGMVQVASGFGTDMWVKEYEELEVSPFLGWSRLKAVPAGYDVHMGVDVSEHQGEIDWAAAKADGVEFAILRAGYRGYGEAGRLAEDPMFRANLAGARAAGVRLGAYFFSQAVTPEEAEEEADFLLRLLSDAGCAPADLALPVFL